MKIKRNYAHAMLCHFTEEIFKSMVILTVKKILIENELWADKLETVPFKMSLGRLLCDLFSRRYSSSEIWNGDEKIDRTRTMKNRVFRFSA